MFEISDPENTLSCNFSCACAVLCLYFVHIEAMSSGLIRFLFLFLVGVVLRTSSSRRLDDLSALPQLVGLKELSLDGE